MSSSWREHRSTLPDLSSLKACVAVIAVVAGGFAAWAMRAILTPLVMAVFLLLMIDGLERVLLARAPRLPRRAALPAAVLLIVGLLGAAVWLAAENAAELASHSGAYSARLNSLLAEVYGRFGSTAPPSVAGLVRQANPGALIRTAAEGIRHLGEGSVFVLIYLGFLLASRQGFGRKASQLFGREAERQEAGKVFERIRTGVESYIWVQTVVGLVIAGLSALVMLALGLEHIAFWALLIFLANYVPAIGAAVGVLFPPVYAILQFGSDWRPVVLLVALEAIHFGVSHVLQPRMQGRSLNLDPIVVLFALAFWGALWGVTGAVLSTPLTVAAMAMLAEFRTTRPLAVLLSGDGEPYSNLRAQADSSELH